MISKMRKGLQRKGARRGFTLVELLIVIIIIGILAGAMLLVAGSSRDTAEASRILSDLRTVKSAAVMWMADSSTTISDDAWVDLQKDPSPLNKYLDRAIDVDKTKLLFATGTVTVNVITGTHEENGKTVTDYTTKDQTAWFLGYDLSGVRDGVKNRLQEQASTAGLYGGDVAKGTKNALTIDLTSSTATSQYYQSSNYAVYVIVQ